MSDLELRWHRKNQLDQCPVEEGHACLYGVCHGVAIRILQNEFHISPPHIVMKPTVQRGRVFASVQQVAVTPRSDVVIGIHQGGGPAETSHHGRSVEIKTLRRRADVIARRDRRQLTQKLSRLPSENELREADALMIWISGQNFVGSLAVENDSHPSLPAELEDAKLSENRERKRRLLDCVHDRI